MASIVDDRGFNQGFLWNKTQELRMRRRAKGIVEAAHLSEADRVLELGCGHGELAHFISEETTARVTGVDICEPFIEAARASFPDPKLSFVVADLSKAEAIDSLGDQWAAVVGNGILHHLYFSMDDALPRLRRLLRPGGRFIFWEPNLFNPYVFSIFSFMPLRERARLEPDEMAFSPRWITERLEQAGYSHVSVSFRDFLVPNLPFFMAPAVTRVGDLVEQVPILNRLAQSLFITAIVE